MIALSVQINGIISKIKIKLRRIRTKRVLFLVAIFFLITNIPRITLWLYPDPAIPFSTFVEMAQYLSSFLPLMATRDFSKCLTRRWKPLQYTTAIVPKKCSEETRILLLIKSSIYRNNLRRSLRKTWAKNVSSSISRIFVTGSLDDDVNERLVINSLIEENKKYNDILQGIFVDTMDSVADKVIMGLKFAKSHCPSVRFIVVADDDSLLIPWNLFAEIETFSNVDYLYAGFVSKNRRPIRNPNSRWFVPKSTYGCNVYPHYVEGQLMILNSKMLTKIEFLSNRYDFVPMDDILIAAMAKMASVTPVELNWTQHSECQELFSVHKTEARKNLLICHGADDDQVQRHLWYELCYSTISSKSDVNLMQLYCSNDD